MNIFHTPDHRLGIRFKNHVDMSETLVKAGYETLEKLVGMASEKR